MKTIVQTTTLALLLSCFSSYAFSQNNHGKESFSDRLTLGGNVGLQFGTQTLINVSPKAGYYITDDLLGGMGLTYTYYNDSYLNYSESVYGTSLFATYFATDFLMLYTEYEALNGYWSDPRSKSWIGSLFVGGGIGTRMGRTFTSFLILYNVNESVYSPYSNPVFRVNFGVGL